MKEKFLHFVWRFQLLHHFPLRTLDGQEIIVHQRGIWNEKDAGPDFSLAKIQIGNQTWFGNLEIHVNSSDWDLHKHSLDQNYQNVILHLVFHHDKEIAFLKEKGIPTLELSRFIPPEIISNYENLVDLNQNFIPCEKSIQLIKKETLNFWLERLVIERLERKTLEIEQEYLHSSKNWEEVLFKKMAYVFGLKVNAEAFDLWANSFEYSVLVKIQTNSDYVHALFLGQAGFLDFDSSDPFVQTLQKEFAFLKLKYNLTPLNVSAFKFFRLRPYSFPTIRLMQLASLYAQYQNVFAFLMGTKSLEKLEAVFEDLVYPEFWQNHFKLDKEANRISSKKISKELMERIIINVVIPICSFMHEKEESMCQKN